MRVWKEDEIKTLIQTNDKVLYRALKRIYAKQTQDEKCAGQTMVSNGVGFNHPDSRFMSGVCKFLLEHGFLTPKQRAKARVKLVKYNRQLTRIANEIEKAKTLV